VTGQALNLSNNYVNTGEVAGKGLPYTLSLQNFVVKERNIYGICGYLWTIQVKYL
jgi:hypothetical protein